MDDKQTDQPVKASGGDQLASALTSLQFEDMPSAASVTTGKDEDNAKDDQPADATVSGFSPADDDSAKNDDSSDSTTTKTSDTSDLDSLKKSALDELRPLVGKLNLSPEEKFDTLLLIIRSTDDQSLLDEAHQAAKSISDETKRAQALLDVIKEVDYFKSKA